MLLKKMNLLLNRVGIRFLLNDRGTPSIETVLIIALIALAVSPFLTDLGTTIGGVFDTLSGSLESTSGGGSGG